VTALKLSDLTVERGGRPVVRDVSIEIPAGQVTALLGPNGAGKSTLVLAVGGVLKPKAGSVLLDAQGQSAVDITGRRPERIRQAGVAIVPEGRRLLPDLTVEDNLRVASYTLTKEQAQVGREKVLELFPQLKQRLAALARTLSGGEQQMVVLAQALISQPRYMLIDELSLGLAPVVVSRLIPVIRTIAESGTGVLLIEQFATVALGLAGHAHIMEGGRIRFSGPAADLRDHPDLLRSAYLLRGSPDKPAAVPPPTSVIPDLFMPNGRWLPAPGQPARLPVEQRPHGLGRAVDGRLIMTTVTVFVPAGTFTTPSDSSIVPADARAMLLTNAGSSNAVGSDAGPVRRNLTSRPLSETSTPILRPPLIGKLVTPNGSWSATQALGTPRPITSEPSARWATTESSSMRFDRAMPQECGEDPPPLAGCKPSHGVVVLGAADPSHHAYGPA
jgi:branched-chain amino acid transport system ATP-binding protein